MRIPSVGPRIRFGGREYGLTLSVPEYAEVIGVSANTVYISLKKGTTVVPPLKMQSGMRFSTFALFDRLSIPYSVVNPADDDGQAVAS